MALRDEILEQPEVLQHWLETQMGNVSRVAEAIQKRHIE